MSQRWLAFGTTGLDDLGIPTTGIEVRGLEFDGTNHGDVLTKIANDYNEVLTGTSTTSFGDAGLNAGVTVVVYWTGATGSNNPDPGETCSNWSTSSTAEFAPFSITNSASLMYFDDVESCSSTFQIICVCY